MGTLLLRFQQLRNGLPSLNVAIPALKMIHVKDVQKVQQHQKSLNRCTIWYWMTGGWKAWNCWDYRHFKRMCRIYFAWRIGYEKALRKNGCHACSQQIKNALAWKSLNSAWSILTKIKLILCVDLLLWIRLVFTITHQNPNSSQNSGQKPVVQRQRRQDRFHQQERSWHLCFGMLYAFCLLISWKG